MNRWIYCCALALALLFALGCGPEFIDQNYRLKITSDTNVRSGPGPEYPVIATAKAGSEVFLLESENDWHRIKMLSGQKGWIFRGIAKTIGPDKVVVLNDARVRRGPGEGFSAFAIVKKGKTLDSRGSQGNWFLVDLTDGKSGWISQKDVEKVSYVNLSATKDTRIYELPNPNSAMLLNVKAGTELIQLGREGDYYMVRLPGGSTGWIHKEYVNAVREQTLTVKARAYVRYGPSVEYEVMETVEKGTRLTQLSRREGWFEVRTPQGNRGWIYQDFVTSTGEIPSGATSIEPTTPYTSTPQPEYLVTNQECNIRQGYGTNWEIIARVKAGTLLIKLGQRDDWLRVRMPDQRIGWIRQDLVVANPVVLVTLEQCNIRKGPGTEYLIVARVEKGTPLVKKSESNGWSEVYLPTGDTGWIRNDLQADTETTLFNNQECNVREGPGTNYRVIERIPVNTPMIQMGQQSNWYQVKLPSNRIGWIREDLLRNNPSQMIANERANIRMGPGTEFQIIEEVEKNTPLEKLEEQGDWYKVKLPNGKIGWIRRDLVSFSFYPTTSQALPGSNILQVQGAVNQAPVQRLRSQSLDVVMITSSGINLRVRPDTSAEVITTLKPGTKLTRINQQGEWFEVQTSDGVLGFVHQSGFGATSKKLYTNAKTNLRFGPSTDYKILAALPEKTEVTRLDERDNWVYVQTPSNQKGWIRKDMLDQKGAPLPGLPRVSEPAFGTLITTSACKVLKEPMENAPTVKSVSLNTELTKLGKYKNWFQVELVSGERGWVSNEFVREKINKKIIAIRKAEVYQQANSQSGLLGTINVGDRYQPLAAENGYYRIQYSPGTTGWVAEKDVLDLKHPPIFVKNPTVDLMRFPDSKSNRVAIIKEGVELTPLDETDDWLFVELPRGDKGWIQKRQVDRQKFPRITVIKATSAYAQASAASAVKASLAQGDQFLALDKKDYWYKILLRDSQIGWVYSGYVQEITRGTLLIRNDSDLRMGPGLDYRIILTVPRGEQVKWLDEKSGWSQIQYKNEVGWVKLEAAKDITMPEMTAGRDAKVYAGPGNTYAQVGEIKKDRRYAPLKKENGWYQLRLPSGTEGWVPMDVFSPKKTRLVFTLDKANIRSGPGLHYSIVAQIEPAVDVTIIGGEGDWYYVQLQDGKTRGYIQKGLVFEE